MKYNQLTYHKANPFYKQDFLPDRAWYNRKPKDFPSEIPTGQEYFAQSGRKHFTNHFNHSEIASNSILQSPQRYPYENRIALDKGYMRNLDTIDIEGAASGTRMNQSIKNKLKAQEQLARRYNQSLDMRQHKDKTYDEKRRQIAQKQYETIQQKKVNQVQPSNQTLTPQKSNQNYSKQEQINQEIYQQHYGSANRYSNKYINLLPKPYYSNIDSRGQIQQNMRQYGQNNQLIKSQRKPNQPRQNEYSQNYQNSPQQAYDPELQMRRYQAALEKERKQQAQYLIPANNRHKSNPQCYNTFDNQLQRRRQEYSKNLQMDELAKSKLQNKKQFRKYNPTNLSFNLAAQSIVGNNR